MARKLAARLKKERVVADAAPGLGGEEAVGDKVADVTAVLFECLEKVELGFSTKTWGETVRAFVEVKVVTKLDTVEVVEATVDIVTVKPREVELTMLEVVGSGVHVVSSAVVDVVSGTAVVVVSGSSSLS